jgi:ADP-ribose pyrophosphatase YjhB (NUDIX family)
MEIDETAEEAAIRETKEETNLDVALDGLLGVYSRSSVGIVVIVYMAHVTDGEPALGPETLEVASFSADEIPWDELSFETTVSALRDWASLEATPGL